MDLEKTMGYDFLMRDGAKVLQKTLTAANGQVIDADIQRDLDQLMKDMATGIQLGKGQFKETVGLIRLVGYLKEMSGVVGKLPAFGFEFKADESGKMVMVFRPDSLDSGLESSEPNNPRPATGMAKVDSARQTEAA